MKEVVATTAIYIRLLEEATTCFRPTQAVPLGESAYRVLPTDGYDPTDEVWEFLPGSTVHCEPVDIGSRPCLLALAELSDKSARKPRGTLTLSGDVVQYKDERGRLLWGLKPETIALVGEYRTNKAPWGDDWFLVFAVAAQIPYFTTCPVYSASRDEGLEFIRARFGIEPKLADGAGWKSVVLWPKAIEGESLIEFSQFGSSNWQERFRIWFDGFIKDSHLSAAVREYLRSSSK